MSQNNNETVTSVGQMRLKRTVFKDSSILRVYMADETLRQLNLNAVYAGVTPDEYVRNLIQKDLGGQIS